MTAVATAAGVAYALGWLTRQPQVAAARREASTDSLTGLMNRPELQRQLLIRAKRMDPYTIYLIDLNGFKVINDTLGHRAGDHLLRQIGSRLSAQLSGHLVARLGGDEFVVIGAGLHTGPAVLAGRINRAIQAPLLVAGAAAPVTVSAAIGFTLALPGADPRAALHTADLAMYRSKALGFPCRFSTVSGHSVDESPRKRIRDARNVRVA